MKKNVRQVYYLHNKAIIWIQICKLKNSISCVRLIETLNAFVVELIKRLWS